MPSLPFLNLFSTIQQVDFSKLLEARNYLVIAGQIIFEKDGTSDEDAVSTTMSWPLVQLVAQPQLHTCVRWKIPELSSRTLTLPNY